MFQVARKVVLATVALFLFVSTSNASENFQDKKKWTFLIFLNADNNLEMAGYEDIREMEKFGSNENVNVVVQFDWLRPKGTQRLYVEKSEHDYGNDKRELHSKIVEEMEEQDMGVTSTFVEFVTWGMENYPAEHYFVIMWNHGSGWSKEFTDEEKGISYDDTSGNHIRTNQLAEALTEIVTATGRKIDILGFDACLMGMFEVADSLSETVDFMIGSEENIPWDGYPYDDLLTGFFTQDDLSPLKLSKEVVKIYGASYSTGGSQGIRSVTNTAFDLSQIDGVKEKLNTWIASIKGNTALTLTDLWNIARDTQSYSDSYRDLGDHVKLVMNKLNSLDSEDSADKESLILAGANLLKSIQSLVVENFNSERYKKSTGVSIYLPHSYEGSSSWNSSYGSSRKEAYLQLEWAKTTDWPAYLDYLFAPKPLALF